MNKAPHAATPPSPLPLISSPSSVLRPIPPSGREPRRRRAPVIGGGGGGGGEAGSTEAGDGLHRPRDTPESEAGHTAGSTGLPRPWPWRATTRSSSTQESEASASLAVTLQYHAKAVALPSPSCPKKCGGVDIVFPFGIGTNCARENFEVDCNKTEDGSSSVAFLGNVPLLNISLQKGQVWVMTYISSMCYNRSSKKVDQNTFTFNSGTAFTFASKENTFTVIGVNTLAYMWGSTYLTGCVSQCFPHNNLTVKAQDGLCTGAGYCQSSITSNMTYYDISFNEAYNTSEFYKNISATNCAEYCGYAVMMEATSFKFRTVYLNTTAFLDENKGRAPVILNWVVGNETCDVAVKKAGSYACRSNNSRCIDSISGPGYLCNCTEGYYGNPYLPDGCHDIDECTVNTPPPCPGYCINTPGNFSCPNEKPPSSSHSVALILAVGSSLGAVVILVITITCTYLIYERKKLANIKKKYFQQHGGMLLLQEIGLKQGTAFTIFTEAELMEATNKYDEKNILGRGGHGTVYKGMLKNGQPIAIKRCVSMTDEQHKKEFGKEMFILSQINHKNIVKLLGCCLEVEVPMLVYEFIPNDTLFHFIHVNDGCCNIPLFTRLRIAHESAQALDYLHSWASPPIIHGDVKTSNILLDENYAAKISDFGASILVPTDEAQFVTLVQGTCGYLDPEYMQTCQLTDKSDVYSFGVVLLELLTGKMAFNLEGPENERSLSLNFLCAVKDGRLMDIIDHHINTDENAGLLEEAAELASQCLEMIGNNRPAMRDVAEKLGRLRKVMQHPWAHHDPEEMESLLGEPSVTGLEMVSTGNFSMEGGSAVQGLLGSGR
uniref:Protein kinase domain-containing protein n=1 Tax=Leersia perrieri TaxID=77586 RepID=A0A0D9WMD4_9ORYZ